MKFLSLRAQNFMSFKEFDFIFPPSGLVFVGGKVTGGGGMSNSNGAGKSAIFEALCWGMYGQSLRSTGKDDIVNYKAKRNCFVEVIFEDDSGNPFIVTRYRSHKEFGNSFTLFQGDKDITASDSKATQDTINSVIKMNWLVFSTAVVFGEKAQRFAEAKDSEKKEIFDEILMFQDYQDALKATKVDRDAAESSLVLRKSELNTYQSKAEVAVAQLEQAKIDLEVWDKRREEIVPRMEELTVQATTLQSEVDALQKQFDKISADVAEAKAKAIPARSACEVLQKEATESVNAFTPLVVRYMSQVSRVEESLRQVSRAQFGKGVGTRCPTCHQPITNESTAEVAAHFASEEARLTAELKVAKAEWEVVETEKKAVTKEYDDRLAKLNNSLHQFDSVIGDGSGVMISLQHTISNKQADVARLIRDCHVLENQVGDNSTILQTAKLAEESVTIYLTKAEEVAYIIADIENELRYFNFWIEGFGNRGIKSFLLDDIIPALTARANYYASVLMDGDSQITFSTESTLKSGDVRDKFDIKLVISGQAVDYKTLSSGEKRRVDVAVLLALQSLIFERSAGSCNVIAFDEVFDSLDITGIEKTIGLLGEEAQQKTIFVISHSQEFSDYFDNVIIVEKKNGVSTLKVDAE